MGEEEFAELLALGYEARGVEFKGPGLRSDKAFLARIVRAVLGMANRRDGGYVVLGVEEGQTAVQPVGMSNEEMASWNYDDTSASIAEYADPYVSLDVEPHVHDGRKYILIRVHEFEEVPVLCKKDYNQSGSGSGQRSTVILRRGACYVRTHGKPSTIEIPTQSEMRELLNLAVDKGVRQFMARAHRAGVTEPATTGEVIPSKEDLFDNQLGDLHE